MKISLKKPSKCALSIVLAVMMLVSSMIVGSGSTAAANTSDTAAESVEAVNDIAAPAEEAPEAASIPVKKTLERSGDGTGNEGYVYFKNTANWDNVYAHRWHNSISSYDTSWSNKAQATLVTVSSDPYYGYYKLPVEEGSSIKFCDKQSGDGNATGDLTNISLDKIYVFSKSKWYSLEDKEKWYVEGRPLGGAQSNTVWVTDSTDYEFTYDSTSGHYKYETNKTISEMKSSSLSYFWFRKSEFDDRTSYRPNSSTSLSGSDTNQNYSLTSFSSGEPSEKFSFNSASSNLEGTVTYWIDSTDSSNLKFYYTVTLPTLNTYTIYFDNVNWSANTDPYVYIYDSVANTYVNHSWPGEAMDLYVDLGTHQVYSYTFETTKSESILKAIFYDHTNDKQRPSEHGYTFQNGYVYTVDFSNNTYSTQTLAQAQQSYTHHTVTASATGNGSVVSINGTANNAEAYVGSEVSISISDIPSGYAVDNVTAADANDLSIGVSGSGNNYSLIMPDSNVTVTVTFRALRQYTITVNSNNTSMGTVARTPATGTVTEGGSVTVTATKIGSNAFTGWAVSYGEGTFADSTALETTFTPSGDTTEITILGSFEEGTITNVDGKYVVYGRGGNNHPGAFNHYTQLKKITYGDNTYKYFVDFDNATFNGGTIYYAVSSSSTPSDWNSIDHRTSEKKVTNNFNDYVKSEYKDYNEEWYDSNNQKQTTTVKFNALSLKDADAVEKVRVYVDTSFNTSSYYTIEATIDASAATYARVYAKDGTIRSEYQKYASFADTTMTYADGTEITGLSSETERVYAKVETGKTIKVTTTLDSGYENKYYVKAFCVNGVSYGVIDEPAPADARRQSGSATRGTYSFEYTIPENTNYVEITPIYFYLENGGDYSKLGFITFHVEKYTGSIQAQWGNTISCQTWYTGGSEKASGSADNKNALGGFPGQPLVFTDGDYFMQVPKALPKNYTDANKAIDGSLTTVQGMTLSNYYWDSTHQYLAGKDSSFKGSSNTRSGRDTNSQTYDYNDFAALAKMGADDIIFTFKYRSRVDNRITTPPDTVVADRSGVWNGWDAFVDYYDRAVDLSGHILLNENTKEPYHESDLLNENPSDSFLEASNKIWIVSKGYQTISKDNGGYYGNYATIWDIYTYDNGSFTNIGSLPGSSFIPPEIAYETVSADSKELPTSGDAYNRNKAKYLTFSTSQGTFNDKTYSDFVRLYNATLNKPVMIAYEKAICEAGYQNDPALRCDGRWYYSTEDSGTVNANLMIEFKPIEETGLNASLKNSEGYYSEASYSDGKGIRTGATVKFTTPDNDDITKVWKNTTGVHATETYSKTEYFEFNADPYIMNPDPNDSTKGTIYEFVGWYIKIGGNYTEINPSDPECEDGRYLRRVTNDFVARYEEISYEIKDLSIYQIMVGHHVDSDSVGGGKAYTTIQVYDSSNNLVKTYSKTESSIMLESQEIETYVDNDNYSFVITLTAEPDVYSSYSATKAEYNAGNTETPNYQKLQLSSTSADPDTLYNGWTNPSANVWTKTFTADQLYSLAESVDFTIDFYSLFNLNTLSVTYKYYDRIAPENNPADISITPTPVTLKVPYTATDTIADIIVKGLGQPINNGAQMTNLKNLLDDYYIWATQADAVKNIKNRPDYATNNTGNTSYISSHPEYDFEHHFDNKGKPAGDNERWVTYTGVSSQPANEEAELALKPGTDVTAVTVWAYNAPRKYNLTFLYPDAIKYSENTNSYATSIQNGVTSGEETVQIFAENTALSSADTNGGKKTIYSLISTAMSDSEVYTGRDTAFYGQRIGTMVGENASDPRNTAGNHINNYGITGYTNSSFIAQKTITRDEIVNGQTEAVTYTFDGWYDADTGAKIASTEDYGYRVTTGLNLIAGYVKASEKTDVLGVSVTENAKDYYFTADETGDDNEATQNVRFNTLLNVYDSPESNKEIKKAAVIYVQMRVQGAGSTYTTDYAKKIIADSGFKTALATNIKVYLNGESVSNGTQMFTYQFNDVTAKVAYERIYVYDTTDTSSAGLTLTNKNRADFVLDTTVDRVATNASQSAILTFGAIYVDGTDWILSDNCIEYVDITKE